MGDVYGDESRRATTNRVNQSTGYVRKQPFKDGESKPRTERYGRHNLRGGLRSRHAKTEAHTCVTVWWMDLATVLFEMRLSLCNPDNAAGTSPARA
jgi:hypothetical protein